LPPGELCVLGLSHPAGCDCLCVFLVIFFFSSRVQWLDEDKDSIQMSSDSEIVEAVAIATQNNSLLEIQGTLL
jgi:hypothetical protein